MKTTLVLLLVTIVVQLERMIQSSKRTEHIARRRAGWGLRSATSS